MHYYNFNIGDYAKDTRHLSNIEDLAYRRLIDLYYDKEKPLIKDVSKLSRLINMRENQEEIATVLGDFFEETEECYKHTRIDDDIANYRFRSDVARANGKRGGRPKKQNPNQEETQVKAKKTHLVNLANQTLTQRKPNPNPEGTQVKANQEPITNNQEPRTKNKEPMDEKIMLGEPNNVVMDIFKFWVDEMRRDMVKTKLTRKRKKEILGRLKEGYTPEDIKTAILNCANSPFHMGNNERNTKYNDIELICRSDKFEQFRDNVGTQRPQSQMGAPSERTVKNIVDLRLE